MGNKRFLQLLLATWFFLLSNNAMSQNGVNNVDEFSKVPCYVEIYKGKKILGNASGFFFQTKTKLYFITNNHVVGGKYYKDEYLRQHKHNVPTDSIPDRLKIRVHGTSIDKTSMIEVLTEVNNKPIYLTFNNTNTDLMDVVAIPIINTKEIDAPNVNVVTLGPINENRDLVLMPSTDLFIVGFPFDYGKVSNYPIWKRGTIASEPNLSNVNNFFIDATTRSGMSGSPVIFRGSSYTSKQGLQLGGMSTFLLGIYSAQNYMTEIGVVWKITKIIDELSKLDK